MTRHDRSTWVATRSFFLWKNAGMPSGRDLEFWLAAEKDYEQCRLCVLTHGSCPFQVQCPINGGRHIEMCMADKDNCSNRAINFNRPCGEKDIISRS